MEGCTAKMQHLKRRHLLARWLVLAVAAAIALVGITAGPSVAAVKAAGAPAHSDGLSSSAPVTVLASGLENPRGLAWGPGGQLLVGVAGTPSSECDATTGECFGMTGSIDVISAGKGVPIVTGLESTLNEEEMIGPDSLIYEHGHLYVLEDGAPQLIPSGFSADLTAELKSESGALLDITGQKISVVANPGSADYEWSKKNKDLLPYKFPSADPYAMVKKPGGGFYLVDAASSTLDSVDRNGNVQVLAFIPPTPVGTAAVPTCLAVGPGGSVYLGELTGHGNSGTAANVYRYNTETHSLTVWQSGFSAINGCGFANGDFYVTELDTTGFLPTGTPAGAVIQVSPGGQRTVLGAGKVLWPTGFLAGPDGCIYVSNDSIIWPVPGTHDDGEVVKIG